MLSNLLEIKGSLHLCPAIDHCLGHQSMTSPTLTLPAAGHAGPTDSSIDSDDSIQHPTSTSIQLPHSTLQQQFDKISKSYFDTYRNIWTSLVKNTAFYRKYLHFKETKKFPTNLQFKRAIFNYSSSWDDRQLLNMINSETFIIIKAQSQILSLRITHYYEMILKETSLLQNLLKPQYIIYHFQRECPNLINFHERFVNLYSEIYDKLTTIFAMPELTEEENLLQFYNAPSELIVTEDSLKRKRTEDYEDKSTRPSAFIPSILSSSPSTPLVTLSSTTLSSSASSSSSSASIPTHTNITTLQDIALSKTNKKNKLKHTTKNNLPKPSKSNTTTKEKPLTIDLSLTPASKLKSTNNNIHNIRAISDQLTSLKNAVTSLISNNQNIKNAKTLHPNVKKKNNLNNSLQTTNIKNSTTKAPFTTKRYNLNQNQTLQPFHPQQIAPTLNLQSPYIHTQQPQYQTYTQQYSTQPSNHYNDNNQYHRHFHLPTQHHINHDLNLAYEARNHLYPHPNHG